ncbi:4'-phosphopantetheinyl transferase superfamily protein [Micromonospora sonneratiae]|uniref:4'-phosphopantetheinyl transferase n=1 Tax=Micromonospora sonneratiae TaxID=1184706 RepID=A0ABW3YSD7_9ACTN
MIEQILPSVVVVVEAFEDDVDAHLFPQEEALVARAVDKRRREFTTVRACARRALTTLGVPAGPILSGLRGAPLWPDGTVGSMTHCAGYRAAVVGRADEVVTVGIDAEPHEPLPDGVLDAISIPEERKSLTVLAEQRPDVHWDRLLFSAKESVYKAWFPLTQRWLGFEDAALTMDAGGDGFTARLLVPGPVVAGQVVDGFAGRWLVRGGLVCTAITVLVR